MRKKISQNEAWTLRHQVKALKATREAQIRLWARDYPSGTNIATIRLDDITNAKVATARRLGFAIVCTQYNSNELALMAVKP